MHDSSLEHARSFFETYIPLIGKEHTVVEFGSNGAPEIKGLCGNAKYIGLDLHEGENVNIVLSDPYQIPLENNSVDVVVSSSCFEHVPMFWLSFLEGLRILKPEGIFYINAPSQGPVHNYPIDCWRFYPDSGQSLVDWANRNGYNSVLLQTFISRRNETWKDCVIVVLKDEKFLDNFTKRMS
jgi:ubiquinone/menaquinone biosynthesis C-methylase UbiE